MSAEDRIERAKTLYKRAVFGGDASVLTAAERDLGGRARDAQLLDVSLGQHGEELGSARSISSTSEARNMTDSGYLSERILFRSCPVAESLRDWAESSRWSIDAAEAGNPDKGVPLKIVWRVSDQPELLLHYVEDAFSDNCYFYLVGEDPLMLQSYCGTIAHRIPTLAADDILSEFDGARTGPERARALMKPGLAAPYNHDEAYFGRIRQGLESATESDRDVAVWASSYSPYPRYLPILERMAEADRSVTVRQRASLVAEAMRHAELDDLAS
jgi:hypothetical protein